MSVLPLTPDQVDRYHESKQTTLTASFILCIIVVNLSIIIRTTSQYDNFRRLYLDDAFILASGVLFNIVAGTRLAATHYGLGLHDWRVAAEDPNAPHRLSRAFEYVWISVIFQVALFSTIRICLLYFNRRLFIVHQRWLRIAWWTNLVYELSWFVGATGFYLFQCWPPNWYWLQFFPRFHQVPPGAVSHGHCRGQTVIYVSIPLFISLLSDVSILLMPIAALLQLQMTWKRRAAMSALLPVGLLFCALEIARIVELWIGTDDKHDPSWGVANFLILSAYTETTAILRACLPVMMPTILRNGMALQDFWRSKLCGQRGQKPASLAKRSLKDDRLAQGDQERQPSHLHEVSQESSQESLESTKAQKGRSLQSKLATATNSVESIGVRTEILVTMEETGDENDDPFYLPYLGMPRKAWLKGSSSRQIPQTV